MTTEEAMDYLGRTRQMGSKLGLENMRLLLEAMGHPQETLRFIHIAGTNGKGSTAAFIAEGLRALFPGAKIGLFTSPHLVRFAERIRIDGNDLPDASLTAGIEAVAAACSAVEATGREHPTYFEVVTALAVWHFRREQVSWIVWETGLGGRLDATNVVNPCLTVITPVGMDHMAYLGNSLEQIAGEKAGILKPGVEAVTWQCEEAALRVIEDRARAVGAPLTVIGRDVGFRDLGWGNDCQETDIEGRRFALGLAGPHQCGNAACAWAALRLLAARFAAPWDEAALGRAFAETRWRGRFEQVRSNPPWVLDGAHNEAGVRCLVETWRRVHGAQRCHLVVGMLQDRDETAMLSGLAGIAASATWVGVASERSQDPARLGAAGALHGLAGPAFASLAEAWPRIEEIGSSQPVLITGSLYLIGEAMARLEGRAAELRLNERLSPPSPAPAKP